LAEVGTPLFTGLALLQNCPLNVQLTSLQLPHGLAGQFPLVGTAYIPAQDVEIAMASDCRSQVLGTTRLNKSHCRRGSQAMRDVATLTNPAQHYFDFFAQALRRGKRLAP